MLKRIVSAVLLAIGSYASIAYGYLQEHPFWMYLGIAIACMLALGIAVWTMKKLAQFIGWALSSSLYIVATLVIVGFLSVNGVIPTLIGYVVAIPLGAMLMLIIIRNLSRLAQRSIIFGEIFSFVSNYKIRSYVDHNKLIDKNTAYTYNQDYKNIIMILKDMQIPKLEAQEAARFAIEETLLSQPLEDKVRVALNYLKDGIVTR